MTEVTGLTGLPNGWTQSKVGEVIDKPSLSGKKLPQKKYQSEGQLPVIDQGQSFIGGYTNDESLKVLCELPVIVFGDHTKAIKYINFEFVAGADGVKVLKAWDVFYPKLFYYFLQSVTLPDRGYSRHFQFLENAFIPIPPLPEQQRIVAKIEELFTKLDAGVDALKKARGQLGRYRRAILNAAVTGELTFKWREAHAGNFEPAAELLAQILAERRAKWEADQLAKMLGAGRPPRNDYWKQKYQEPAAPDTNELPELPKGWVWTHLEQLLSVLRNGIGIKPDADEGIPILRISALRPMSVNLEDCRFLHEDYESIAEYVLEDGDLLFTRYNGNPSLVGICGVVRSIQKLMVHPDKLIRGEVASELSLPTFLQIVLNIGKSREFIAKRARTTAGQTGISGGDLKSVPVPLAPHKEQEIVVEEVERLLSIADAMEQTIEQTLKQAERLRQSILQQAFTGNLVSQDPNDEPASRLLERIRKERARKVEAVPKQKRKSSKHKQAAQNTFFS